MNRHLLRVIVALGLVVTLVSGAGVFAVFTDQATTGPNSVTSGPVAAAADLKLAAAAIDANQVLNCDPNFQDHLTAGPINVANVQPSGNPLQTTYFCLQNAGSAALDVVVSAIELVDLETACTGDEATVDTSCGLAAAGELSPRLYIAIHQVDCMIGQLGAGSESFLPAMTVTPIQVPGAQALAPNSTLCGAFRVYYPTTATVDQIVAAQTDQATWRFAFDGTTQ